MKRWKKMLLITLAALLAVALGGALFVSFAPQFGARATGERLERMKRSGNFRDGRFQNLVDTPMSPPDSSMFGTMVEFLRGGEDRTPGAPLPVVSLNPGDLGQATDGAPRVTWLGHSTTIVEMAGQVILTDPVFGERASPVPFMGPKRFSEELPIALADLPTIDAVVISHDHYDHLDHGTIVALKDKVTRFYAPLGVGAHLERWGVAADRIVELDWWEEARQGGLTLTATPSRHFSGRGLTDRDRTLWASWAIRSAEHRVFFGGDSGYFDGFREIGERLGPFDVTMLESGAYNEAWPYIHMMPEQTVQAHRDLRGRVLLPIHWGRFSLALHAWTEPVERLLAEAKAHGVTVATPVQGQRFALGAAPPQTRWWEATRLAEAPVEASSAR